ATFLTEWNVVIVEPEPCQGLLKNMKSCGFPFKGRDVWYVRASMAVVSQGNSAKLITEDIDFYDPRMKGCSSAKRIQILHRASGDVARVLRREGVEVICVAQSVA